MCMSAVLSFGIIVVDNTERTVASSHFLAEDSVSATRHSHFLASSAGFCCVHIDPVIWMMLLLFCFLGCIQSSVDAVPDALSMAPSSGYL